MKVRELAGGDLDGVYALRMHRYTEVRSDPAYGMGTRSTPPTPTDFAPWFAALHAAVRDRTGVCFVAEEDGTIVGMARIGAEDDALETKHVGVLSIEVLPAFRGQGVGSMLLAHALGQCAGRFELVKLEVLPENAAGRRLYSKFGFEEYGRLPKGFYRAGTYHDFILMQRPIPPPSGPSPPR